MDNQHYITLTREQWSQVLDKASSNESIMFILRSWANTQSVSAGSVPAFDCVVRHDLEARKQVAPRIGTITKWGRVITSTDNASCYIWNEHFGVWSIGWDNVRALREAFAAHNSEVI